MSWLSPLLVVGGIAVSTLVIHLRRQAERVRAVRRQLCAEWGRPQKHAADLALVASYHDAVNEGVRSTIDSRTWRDLDLDAVFLFLDRTSSSIGRQLLYHRLRSTAHSPAQLAAFDELVEAARRDERTRLDVQMALGSLNTTSMYWLWSLAFEPIDSLPRLAVIYPLFAAVMAAAIVLALVFETGAFVLVVAGLPVAAMLRVFGRRLVPLNEPFRDMVRLLGAAGRLARLERLPPAVRETLRTRLPGVAGLRRWAGWIARDQTVSGDIGGFVVEYVNMLFCLDVNAAMLGVRELRRHQDDLRVLFEAMATLDAAVSVASVRDGAACSSVRSSGTDRLWARPQFDGEGAPARFEDLRHPLLENAVPNSLTLGPPAGLLVTGANMTGKSTFLRTIGVNVVLAQSINTVFASSYRAPWLSVGSCIAPADDLQSGKSYYQVEVETLVGMLAGLDAAGTRLYLFDELFRGTNTLDRISAASAVLQYLVSMRCGLVVAATHDLELVSLLTPGYEVVHFGDELTDAGLRFDYALRPGPATTRNAIALLGVLGAPPEIVSEALERADRLRAVPGVPSRGLGS